MKKLFSLLLVVAMLFGMATTAFAYTDVTATAQTGPVEKLNALGILKGYADGTFKPENPITRAEFAAVIVRAMGLESAAQLINNPTKFTDVTAQHAWAYGYINIATAKGIIKGDPDGKFRPADKVSYAEVVTMILRAGGWDAACSTMDWPAGFVMKAVEFGLTAGVTFDANTAANRGAVAVMTYNALSMPMAKWNDGAKIWESDAIDLGAKYLNASEYTTAVLGTPAVDAGIAAGKVETEDGVLAAPAGVDVNTLLGKEVCVIRVGTAYVYMKDVQPADRVITGIAVGDYAGANAITYKLTASATTNYTKNFVEATNGDVLTYIYRNSYFATYTPGSGTAPYVPGDYAAGAYKDGDTVKIYLDENGEVRFVNAVSFSNWMRVSGLVTKGVNSATTNEILVGTDHYVVADNASLTKNGTAATFADIKVGDIVYISSTGTATPFNAYVVDAYSKVVNGAIGATAINLSNELTLNVGGTVYPVDAAATMSVNGATAATITLPNLAGVSGFSGTVSLDKDGYIVYIKADTTALVGYYVSKDTTAKTVTFAIRGANQTFSTTDTLVAGAYTTTTLYRLTQQADGKIVGIAPLSPSTTGYKVKSIDAANKIVTFEDLVSSAIDTATYDTATFGLCGGTWANMTNLTVGASVNRLVEAGNLSYYETYTAAPGSNSGRFLGFVQNAGTPTTWTIYLEVKGAVVSYVSDASVVAEPGTTVNTIVDVDLTGGKYTAINSVTWSADYTIVAISGNTFTLDDGTNLSVEDLGSASIYTTAGVAKTLADLEVDDVVKLVTVSSTVVYVQIQ